MDIPTILCQCPTMRSDDPKIIVQLAPSLIAAVDDFRFTNRIDSRAKAIRLLLQRGLDAEVRATAPKRPARRQA